MKNLIISPSILSVFHKDLHAKLSHLESIIDCWVHIDVMDGKFVPNSTIGFDEIKNISDSVSLIKDVHIMVENPLSVAQKYLDCGADILTFHIEACKDINEANEIISLIHKNGKKAGISIKPNTSVECVLALLDHIDLVLVMSVEPGLGGQKFMPSSLEKIEKISSYAKENNLDLYIEVDGGINEITGKQCVESGANVLVSGTYVFQDDDIETRINNLRK